MLKEAGGDYVLIQVRGPIFPTVSLSNVIQIQYGDLWQTLYEGALEAGAEVLTGVDVTSIDPANSNVTVANGDVLTADLIIGADGPRGRGRRLLLDQDAVGDKMAKSFMMYECVYHIPHKCLLSCETLMLTVV